MKIKLKANLKTDKHLKGLSVECIVHVNPSCIGKLNNYSIYAIMHFTMIKSYHS